MLFSVPQQDRTTLFHLSFSGLAPFVALVLILWASIASASRLAIGLQHARPHLAEALKRSVRLMDTIALLFALSPVLEKEFLVPSMAFITANAYDIVCRLDRDDTLDDVPQNKKQKIATGLLLDILHKQDFAGPLSSRVSGALGPIGRHRVADILHRRKIVSRASRPGYSLVSYASYVMGSALHRDFTLKNMITPAVLDAQMNLTLSHIAMNVPGCTTFLFLSGDMLRSCLIEIIFYTT